MLTTDTVVNVLVNRLGKADSSLHEATYTYLVKLNEGVSLENLAVEVSRHELRCIVS